ncbi:MAG: ribonuclease III [Clostridiales bacterium]|jgi:ribonuclease-3 family protein|nr:ribonuclease III [Clostridiales bacterium]
MSLLSTLCAALQVPATRDAAQTPPLVLAYMGDTIYDLAVRTALIETSDATAHGLHMKASEKVRAAAQARAAQMVLPRLSEEETTIYRRGRNAHMGSVPKNATIAQYRAATGLEAVLGYLYLRGRDERLLQLLNIALHTECEGDLT